MKTYTEAQVRWMLADAVKAAGGQRAFGSKHFFTGKHVGRVLAGDKLSPAILKALGLEVHKIEATYRRIRR